MEIIQAVTVVGFRPIILTFYALTEIYALLTVWYTF